MLGVANDIGESMGLVPGLACNRFPPWVILLFGAFCCFLGYGAIWLAVSRTVPNLPYWLVSLMFIFSLCEDLSLIFLSVLLAADFHELFRFFLCWLLFAVLDEWDNLFFFVTIR